MALIEAIAPKLLAHVGTALPAGGSWRRMGGWDEACTGANAATWRDFQLELSNQLRFFIQNSDMDEYRRWNAVVDELKSEHAGALTGLTWANPAPYPHRKWVGHSVAWDLLLMGVAEGFGRLQQVPRYVEIADVYLAGRFPCGTVDEADDGALLVL